jgi:uncharacterized DUF497 family protein
MPCCPNHRRADLTASVIGEQDGDEVIRIISARKATPSERTLYEEETD